MTSDNTYIHDNTYIQEEDGEEGIRGQVQGRGRGRGGGRGRRRGHGIGRGRGRGNGRGRSYEEEVPTVTSTPEIGNSCARNSSERRHTEEKEKATINNTSRPRNGASCAMNSSERHEVDNSRATHSVERHEIGNLHATNGNGVCNSLLQPQIDEEEAESGYIFIFDDTNMLKCPICFKTFSIDIYQCKNGHTACSSCYREVNKCPRCSIDYFRCHLLEEVRKTIKITCLNSKYGCKEKVSYNMKLDLLEHARSCAYKPCNCPLPGCGFDGSCEDLYLHFAGKHPASATRFTFGCSFPVDIGADMSYKFLQEDDHTLFILNYSATPFGIVAEVICMGPSSLQDEYSYDLEARNAHRSIKATSLTRSQPKWSAYLPQKPALLVTKDLTESSWDQKIQVCICRKSEN